MGAVSEWGSSRLPRVQYHARAVKRSGLYGKRDLGGRVARPWSRYLMEPRQRGHVTLAETAVGIARQIPHRHFIPKLTGKGGISNFESVGNHSLTKLENGRSDGS